MGLTAAGNGRCRLTINGRFDDICVSFVTGVLLQYGTCGSGWLTRQLWLSGSGGGSKWSGATARVATLDKFIDDASDLVPLGLGLWGPHTNRTLSQIVHGLATPHGFHCSQLS